MNESFFVRDMIRKCYTCECVRGRHHDTHFSHQLLTPKCKKKNQIFSDTFQAIFIICSISLEKMTTTKKKESLELCQSTRIYQIEIGFRVFGIVVRAFHSLAHAFEVSLIALQRMYQSHFQFERCITCELSIFVCNECLCVVAACVKHAVYT